MTSIMGIDPGIKGGIVTLLIDKEGVPFFYLLEDTDYFLFRDIVCDDKVQHIYLEKAQSMPKQGVKSMFTYGVGFGKILGWIDSLMIPLTLVTPQQWTKVLHQGCTGKDSKAKSMQASERLFPTIELRATERSKKPHMGLVDALLIAEYGRRIFK